MSEWQTVRIGDVAEVFDGPHATPKKVSDGPLFLGISSLDSGRLNLEASENISEDDFIQWTRRVTPRYGDIVFSYETRIGQAAIIPQGLRCCLGRRMALIRPKKALDARFFLYQYLSPAYQAFLKSRTIHGSTVDRISLAEFPSFPITLPSLQEQRAIAHILGTLDDKIELNRRMNETLEAMARAIFQSWFVDFDPVRAKASGESADSICQRLGFTPELLALFPDSFEDSELGEVPKGWGVSPLGDLSSYLSRGISPKYLEEGGVCVLNQKCIRDGKVSTASARRHDNAQRSIAGRELVTGDILVNSTGTGTLGRVAQVMALDEPTIVDSHVTVVRANPIACAPSYLSLTLMERQAEIEALGEGSTGQTELARARLAALKVLTPPINLMNLFDGRVKAFRETSSRNDRQNTVLAATRDALLPKLLSGEMSTQGR